MQLFFLSISASKLERQAQESRWPAGFNKRCDLSLLFYPSGAVFTFHSLSLLYRWCFGVLKVWHNLYLRLIVRPRWAAVPTDQLHCSTCTSSHPMHTSGLTCYLVHVCSRRKIRLEHKIHLCLNSAAQYHRIPYAFVWDLSCCFNIIENHFSPVNAIALNALPVSLMQVPLCWDWVSVLADNRLTGLPFGSNQPIRSNWAWY